jgi:hypothetical protein
MQLAGDADDWAIWWRDMELVRRLLEGRDWQDLPVDAELVAQYRRRLGRGLDPLEIVGPPPSLVAARAAMLREGPGHITDRGRILPSRLEVGEEEIPGRRRARGAGNPQRIRS